MFNEVLMEGKWVRNGPNETLDLYGYTEAARLMLQPDRASIVWSKPESRPVWARPISLTVTEPEDETESPATPKPAPATQPKQSILDRFGALNSR
jgi:phage terminase large subunit GpA-like protein